MCEACSFNHMNRRQFMATASALTAAGFSLPGALAATPGTQPGAARKPIRIGVMLGRPGPADRGWDLCADDFAEIAAHLEAVEQKLGNVEFVTRHVGNAQEAAALMNEAGDDAPMLAVSSGIGWLIGVMPPVLEANRPTAVYSVPGSGHDWMYPPRWQREGHRVTLIPSSNLNDLEYATRLLRTMPLMKRSRVLLFPPAQGTTPSCDPNQVRDTLGTDVVAMDYDRIEAIIDELDPTHVDAVTDEWIDGAQRVVEPSRHDVVMASRMCLAFDRLIEEEQANGVAVGGCLGWLERGFPCLAFTRLRDRGIPAACEGDMDSLLTMLFFQHAFDLPGFQGNNYFDTAQNSLWTAHCTGALKMDGIDGESAPYLLRGHSEVGGDGAVPEALYRVGQKITRTKFIDLDTFLVSTGTIAEVPEKSTIACRTQIRTEVEDAEQMAVNWGGGVLDGCMMTLLHRVVFYGDHTRSLQHLAHLTGMKVVEEV